MTLLLVFVLLGLTWVGWRFHKMERAFLDHIQGLEHQWVDVTDKLTLVAASNGNVPDQDRLLAALSRDAQDIEHMVESGIAPLVVGQREVRDAVAHLVAGMQERQHEIERHITIGKEQTVTAVRDAFAGLTTQTTSVPAPKVRLTLPPALIAAAERRGIGQEELQRLASQAFQEMVTTE